MLHRIERLLLDLAVVAVIGLCLLITGSVVLRMTLNSGIPDTLVMVAELMVAAIVLPLAAATTARAHIVVEFFSQMMSPPAQDRLVIAGGIFGLFALSPLIYAGWNEVVHTVGSGTFFFGELNLPKWPGRVIFLVGISFCWLRLLLMTLADVRTIRAGGTIDRDGPTSEDLLEERA